MNIENENSFEKYYKEIENKFGDKYNDYLKYFHNEWKQYFINKMLYYNFNDKHIRTNNFIENYNSQINRILNCKKFLAWSDYIKFFIRRRE